MRAAPLVLASTPPLIVKVPVPMAAALLKLSVPLESVRPPEKLLLPERVKAAVPDLIRLPTAAELIGLRSLIVPPKLLEAVPPMVSTVAVPLTALPSTMLDSPPPLLFNTGIDGAVLLSNSVAVVLAAGFIVTFPVPSPARLLLAQAAGGDRGPARVSIGGGKQHRAAARLHQGPGGAG